ncbi:hypothetical protein N799_07470 [Lysobacter arseniciresistens ZS79]|uniref:Autotransporter domain-containing protein n=1 Tax=Lysobacter arseniciresistens ZS79 TaxID=913325 RepID=A0A0A0EWB4_9GAMM|nr:autotransporter serine protease [Lysobacter arseniciresistens]KGM53412.1 hypothetical protein N799_07470 [Lysobacter arseniciresistens ZS79]
MSKNALRTRPSRSTLCRAIAGCLLAGLMLPAMAQDAPPEDPGQVGDEASWRTDEFLADWGLGAIGAEYAYARGLTGYGIRLGVFDSGVAFDHPEFAGGDHVGLKFGDPGCSNTTDLWGCFYSDGGQPSVEGHLAPEGYVWSGSGKALELEYNAHGTHVGGTMAAGRNGSGMHGVAFGSGLVSAQLFTNRLNEYFFGPYGLDTKVHGTSPTDEALADMYAQMAANDVRAINHSWGYTIALDSAGFADYVYEAIGGAEFFEPYAAGSRDLGMLQVWAAGNGGDDGIAGNGTGNFAGLTATLPRWLPELEPYWLSVANMNMAGELADSSNMCGLSMDWCITAPGTDIASTVLWGELNGEVVVGEDGTLTLEFEDADRQLGYAYYTGTSMAAPHVTGALALLMERYPYLDNVQIRDVLLTTARDMGVAGVDELYGWGLMDLRKAIEGYGQLRVDTDIVMNRKAGGAKVWEGEAWDDWTNDIGGPGRMTKSGIGWLRLSGDNSFAGLTVNDGVLELTGHNALGDTVVDGGLALVSAGGVLANLTTVNGGWLQVNGVQSGGLVVNAGGSLRGIGTVGDTSVAGTIAPGNSVGTLAVDGDYTQLAGSFYNAEFAGAASDRISVTGTADLLGGTVRLFGAPGVFDIGASYTLLEAAAVNGAFAGVDSSAFSPFLAFNLGYGAEAVTLDVVRGMALADAATTPNQLAVATAADAMADDAALLGSLVQLFPQQAQGAFDLLGGEFHPAARAVLVEDSRLVREAALARTTPLQSALDDGDAQTAVWAQAFKSGGSVHGDANTGRINHDGNGVLVGLDHRFAGGWRVGVLGGTGRTDIDLRERASSGDVKHRHLGVYGGNQWGALSLRAGLARADQEIDGERSVAFADVDQFLHTEYDATTTQAFVEGGYAFGREAWTVEPYLQVARVDVDTDAFTEEGGNAALSGNAAETRTTLSTLGVRFDVNLSGAQPAATGLHLRGGLGYRNASGDTVAEGVHAWAGGQSFTVTGAPLAESSTVAEAGIAAQLGERSLLEFSYSGQFADEARDHGASVRYSLTF